jgi:hypothetical protein
VVNCLMIKHGKEGCCGKIIFIKKRADVSRA